MTLVMALFTMLSLTITTLALLTMATTEPRIAANLLHGSQAFYLAESGLEIALAMLQENRPLVDRAGTVGAGHYSLTFTEVEVTRVRVRSVGRVGRAVRVVSNQFEQDADGIWRPMKSFREEAL
jgi:type II secretory pathway component PulK